MSCDKCEQNVNKNLTYFTYFKRDFLRQLVRRIPDFLIMHFIAILCYFIVLLCGLLNNLKAKLINNSMSVRLNIIENNLTTCNVDTLQLSPITNVTNILLVFIIIISFLFLSMKFFVKIQCQSI